LFDCLREYPPEVHQINRVRLIVHAHPPRSIGPAELEDRRFVWPDVTSSSVASTDVVYG
jgi:hypothetical protein